MPTNTVRSAHDEDRRLGWRAVMLILLYGGSMLLLNLGSTRVLTYHEVLFAQPAKEMVASGDWVLTTMGGVASTHKPPLTQWLIAVSMAALRSEAEWVVRLPIVLATLAAAVLMASLAARWHGRQVGVLTGLIQLTSFYVLMQARLAESDMILCAVVCAAMACWGFGVLEHVDRRPPTRSIAVCFYLATGMSFLAKGPLGPILILGSCGLFLVADFNWSGFWRRLASVPSRGARRAKPDCLSTLVARGGTGIPAMRFLFNPLGLAIFAACILAWPLATYSRHPQILADWEMHHLGRFQGEMGGQKPALFYAYVIPFMILPWTPFALSGLWQVFRRQYYHRAAWRLMGAWFAFGMLVFSLAAWKHKHYVIPILPPLSMAAAIGLAEYVDRIRQALRVDYQIPIAIIVTCAAALAPFFVFERDLASAIAPLSAISVCGVAALFWPGETSSATERLVGAFAALWLVAVGVQTWVMPHFDSYRDQASLARRAAELVPAGEPILLLALPENQIIYYTRSPLLRDDRESSFMQRFQKSRSASAYVLAPSRVAQKLAAVGDVTILDRCPSLRRKMTEGDRITLVRVAPKVAADTSGSRKY